MKKTLQENKVVISPLVIAVLFALVSAFFSAAVNADDVSDVTVTSDMKLVNAVIKTGNCRDKNSSSHSEKQKHNKKTVQVQLDLPTNNNEFTYERRLIRVRF